MSSKAAEHHTHAARHHSEAAKHHEAGNHEKAAHHAPTRLMATLRRVKLPRNYDIEMTGGRKKVEVISSNNIRFIPQIRKASSSGA